MLTAGLVQRRKHCAWRPSLLAQNGNYVRHSRHAGCIHTSPPSGLDAASEELVFDAIDRLIEGKTAIRDRLLALDHPAGALGSVVQDGRIVESGSHEPLLGPGGLYASL